MTDTLQTSCHLALPAAALKAVVLRLEEEEEEEEEAGRVLFCWSPVRRLALFVGG